VAPELTARVLRPNLHTFTNSVRTTHNVTPPSLLHPPAFPDIFKSDLSPDAYCFLHSRKTYWCENCSTWNFVYWGV